MNSDATPLDHRRENKFRILCLDGGGAKGMYTLGLLEQVEALSTRPLCESFDMIYGTSTGAIITAMLGLGIPTKKITETYMRYVPDIMAHLRASKKTAALKRLAGDIFEDKTFEEFKTYIGIVATNWDLERPLIFKSSVAAAFGSKATFKPGFGCTIAEAVQASSAATPFFERPQLETENHGRIEAADGGFFANNPTLLALTDALGSLKKKAEDIRVLSVGCGRFPEKRRNLFIRLLKRTPTARLLQKVLSTNSATIEQQCKFLFPDVQQLRVNGSYESPELATDFLESDCQKLEKLYLRGKQSFENVELDVKKLLTQ